jgi:hypothetical protein
MICKIGLQNCDIGINNTVGNACFAKLVPIFGDTGYRVVSMTNPYAHIFCFFRSEPLLSLSSSSSIVLTRLSGPCSRHYFSENLVTPGIEPGTSGSVARNSEH